MSEELTPSAEPASVAPITFEQARVLGSLVEKEMTTPENYPLTLNSLVTACNQSSNREPVVSFDEATVLEALDVLKSRGLAFQVTIPGARVQKYKHNLNGKFPRLEKPGLALMCVLLLRGAQTAGELRARTVRMHAFEDIPSLEGALQELINYPETPLAASIPAGGGRKTVTYAHLLCGAEGIHHGPVVSTTSGSHTGDADWKSRIEQELAALRDEVAELRSLIKPEAPPLPGESSPAALGTYVP
jgi:uncharacterized protein YceH (UPF0502 family)